VIFLLSSSLEKQGIPYRAAKQICIKGRLFQKGESFSCRASFQALAQCEAQQLEGVNCLVVKSDDMLTIWREIPRHEVVLPSGDHLEARKVLQETPQNEFFNRSPLSSINTVTSHNFTKNSKNKRTKHNTMDMQRLFDWVVNA
jgi:hypothetical protein